MIDCDVHVAVPGMEALTPFLQGHWVDFVDSSGFGQPGAVEAGFPSWSPQLRRPGSELTLDRIRADVLAGAQRAVLNVHYGTESLTHPYLAPALAAAVNQWTADAWLSRDERLLGSIVVAPQFADAAADEIERAAGDRRFVQIVLPARAWDPYGHDRYRALWAAAAACGLAVAIAYGGATGTPPTALGWMSSLWEDHVLGAQPFQTHLVSIVMSGLLERHPSLRIVLLSSGWTWLPALMWKMDAEWRAFRREVPWVRRPPSEYVREHVRFSLAPIDCPVDDALTENLEQLGSDRMMMFGSDYPHRHVPDPEGMLALLDPVARERALDGNAVETYRLNR